MWVVAAAILLLSANSMHPLAECPRGEDCTPCTNLSSSSFLIFCGKQEARSGPHFRVEYRSEADVFSDELEIKCVGAPNWSDFHLGTDEKMKSVSVMSFTECDLPAHGQLVSVMTQLLGNYAAGAATDHEHSPPAIRELKFNSYGNLQSALVKTTLVGFTNCLAVDLSHNGLRILPEDLLRDFFNLETLDLGFNDLRKIPPKFLNSFTLQTLVLQENHIRAIDGTTFANVPSLEALNLSKNRIKEIDGHAFDALSKLRTLNLRGNDLMSLPATLFSNLEALIDVNLSSNNFSHDFLPSHYFANSIKLEAFDLSDNKQNLGTISGKFLSGMEGLKTLKLDDSGISDLTHDFLLRARHISSLTISGNYLVTIPDGIFKNCYIMKTIDFSRNYITHISTNTFKHLNEIENLNMSYNKVKYIEKNAFKHPEALHYINYFDNTLIFDDSRDISSIMEILDTVIKNIQELNFDNNEISTIPSDWLNSDGLGVLRLRNNHITHLSHLHLCFHSEKTVQVNLRDNKIVTIDLSGLESPEFNESVFSGREVYPVVRLQLANNPLECDCKIYHLLRYHEKRMSPSIQRLFELSIEGLTCAGPPEHLNTPVKNLNSELLICRLLRNSSDGRTCPDACDCFHRVEDSALLVNCSQRGFSRPSIEFNPSPSRHTELNLTGNSLKNIPRINPPSFDNITVLSLSDNQITDLSLRDLSQNLTELYLDGNNLTRLDGDVIKFLTDSVRLKRLTLHRNPWKCDCDTLDFFYFIQSNHSKYNDLQRVTCNSSDTPIFKMLLTDVCPPSPAMIIAMTLTAFLILISAIIATVYYRYETEIKVWLFAHRLLPWLVNEAEVDRDKVYDAFISYSHQDEDFVVNELVAKLEEGPPGFKLCIHYRDWLVGEFIGEQIARSVAESRRTVVVVSRNFLESEWGRMEFRTAHCMALKEGKARVIVIIYGDIGPIDELEPELASYMRTNTYVQWGDRWFWEKLRYALPHPVNSV